MNVVTILVGNKTDLVDAREVGSDEGRKLAVGQGLFFVETSALYSSNLSETVVKEIDNISSRKVRLSQENKKGDIGFLNNGKPVAIQGDTSESDGQSRSGCC